MIFIYLHVDTPLINFIISFTLVSAKSSQNLFSGMDVTWTGLVAWSRDHMREA